MHYFHVVHFIHTTYNPTYPHYTNTMSLHDSIRAIAVAIEAPYLSNAPSYKYADYRPRNLQIRIFLLLVSLA
jgi:hypothetical protein